MCVCARVCERGRERERDRVTSQHISYLNHGLCVCVRVCVCERERETGSHHSTSAILIAACMCLRERERQGQITVESAFLIVACVQTHTSIITVSVTRLCSPLALELMVKLRTLLTVFTLILKAEARNYGKGRYISDVACGVRPITMHCTSLANQSRLCLSEGGTL